MSYLTRKVCVNIVQQPIMGNINRAHCEDAYREYLDDNETSENVVKYASKVILTNKEDIDEYTTKI